jgi:uncharacterized membrane protein
MIDVIFAVKFLHLVAAALMLGSWLAVAIFILLAHRSDNPSVVALIFQFVVRVEITVVAAAFTLEPLSGFPLAWSIGLAPFNELWIDISLVVYLALLACWVMAVRTEMRIRRLTREAALKAVPLGPSYRRLFRVWCALAVPILIGMTAVFALMVWQPRFD